MRVISFFLVIAFIMNGCGRVDTNSEPLIHQVQDEISQVYWDSSFDHVIVPISTKSLLQNALTDETAIQIALLNNRHLQSVYESLGVAKADLAQAGLLKNPIFSFSYEFSMQSAVTDLINFGLMQNFLELLMIPMKKRVAEAELDASKNNLAAELLGVIVNTKVAFFTLLAYTQIGELKKEILLANELSYEAAKKLFAAGNIKDLEVAMEQTLYEQAKLQVASWEIAILDARERLNVLMGLWGNQIEWRVSQNLPSLPSAEEDYANIENVSITNSYDLKIAYNNLVATAAGFGIDTSKFIFPALDIGAAAERDEGVWYVGPAINLALPFFDRGKANSARARAKIMQLWNQYLALAIDIRSCARSSRFSLLNAFRMCRYTQEITVPLAEEVTHLTLLQHNAMQLGIFHLLSAKRRELENKVQSKELQLEYWIAKTKNQALLNGYKI